MNQSKTALVDGCAELDMVINISKALSGDWDYVRSEVQAVVETVHNENRQVKVIFETCYLSDDYKIRLCEICGDVGADWVKISTGFGTAGATVRDLTLMRNHSPESVQVKASGGICALDTVLAARHIGITRIGTSSTQTILDEARVRLALPSIECSWPTAPAAGY